MCLLAGWLAAAVSIAVTINIAIVNDCFLLLLLALHLLRQATSCRRRTRPPLILLHQVSAAPAR
jgi:hypothetical protein